MAKAGSCESEMAGGERLTEKTGHHGPMFGRCPECGFVAATMFEAGRHQDRKHGGMKFAWL